MRTRVCVAKFGERSKFAVATFLSLAVCQVPSLEMYVVQFICSGCFFKGYEYYLSDSSGLPITTVVHKRDGSCESHTWTLKN